jgi:hypothetical protein
MYTAGTKTISTDTKCIVQRRKNVIFREVHSSWAKKRNIKGEMRRTSRSERGDKETEIEIIYTKGET